MYSFIFNKISKYRFSFVINYDEQKSNGCESNVFSSEKLIKSTNLLTWNGNATSNEILWNFVFYEKISHLQLNQWINWTSIRSENDPFETMIFFSENTQYALPPKTCSNWKNKYKFEERI